MHRWFLYCQLTARSLYGRFRPWVVTMKIVFLVEPDPDIKVEITWIDCDQGTCKTESDGGSGLARLKYSFRRIFQAGEFGIDEKRRIVIGAANQLIPATQSVIACKTRTRVSEARNARNRQSPCGCAILIVKVSLCPTPSSATVTSTAQA